MRSSGSSESDFFPMDNWVRSRHKHLGPTDSGQIRVTRIPQTWWVLRTRDGFRVIRVLQTCGSYGPGNGRATSRAQ